MAKFIYPVKNNKELIDLFFTQIERDLNIHITDKEYIEDTWCERDNKDICRSCEFHIKEIPHFRFAVWCTDYNPLSEGNMSQDHINWMSSLYIPVTTELIFFTQDERYLDKFKPSRSGFVTGIYRNQFLVEPEEKSIDKDEYFNIYEVEQAIKYIRKHPIKSALYAASESKYIWEDDRSGIKLLREFIHDRIYDTISSIKNSIKLQILELKSVKCMNKISQFNYIIYDMGENWSPRIHIAIRRKDQNYIEKIHNETNIIERFADKHWNDISLIVHQFDMDTDDSKSIAERDKQSRMCFYELYHSLVEEVPEDEECNVLAYNVQLPDDYQEIINKVREESN